MRKLGIYVVMAIFAGVVSGCLDDDNNYNYKIKIKESTVSGS